ncbi:hypothetical protein [Terrabacter sp. NPDC000476]|uniref:hypothetical protein n=1 Tax=Terrabacter sp. NPDC000476 TaxID=3154258 RepID=UPI00332D90ED
MGNGVTPGKPANGTGEVVIIRTESPTADVWCAMWMDEEVHMVDGPFDSPLETCLAWALGEARPSEVRIITSYPTDANGPGLVEIGRIDR